MSPARVTEQHGDHTFNEQRLLLPSGMLAQERGLELQKRPRSERERSESNVAVPCGVLGKTLHKQTRFVSIHSGFVTTILRAILGITEAFLAHYNFCATCF